MFSTAGLHPCEIASTMRSRTIQSRALAIRETVIMTPFGENLAFRQFMAVMGCKPRNLERKRRS